MVLALFLKMKATHEFLLASGASHSENLSGFGKKNEAVITAMLTKCSLLYKNCIFLSEIRKWLRTSHLGVTSPSPNYVKIKMNISYGYTGFLTFIFSELASLLRNCSVPQRQVINAFWKVFLINAWLTLFLCGVCVLARKLGTDVPL